MVLHGGIPPGVLEVWEKLDSGIASSCSTIIVFVLKIFIPILCRPISVFFPPLG